MYAIKPFNNHVVTVKIPVGIFEISIGFDDSSGALKELSRGDIRVYVLETGEDITASISTDTIPADIDKLIEVYRWCLTHYSKMAFIYMLPERIKELDDFLRLYIQTARESLITVQLLGEETTLPKEEAMKKLWASGIRRDYNEYVVTGVISRQEYFEYCCKQDSLLWAEQEKKLLEEGSKA